MSGRVEAVGPCAVRSKLNKFEHVQGVGKCQGVPVQ